MQLNRVLACVPGCCQLSLHYSGQATANDTAPGLLRPFAFDIGDFASESHSMLYVDPFLTTARTQVSILCSERHRSQRLSEKGPAILPKAMRDHTLWTHNTFTNR